MNPESPAPDGRHLTAIKWLTYLMFLMFAMTTDSVGVIIPEVIKDYGLSLTAASAFHYGTMGAMAIAGISLGFLADRLGHKRAILLGLGIFAVSSYLFAVGNQFGFFLSLLVISGVAIGIFKSGALALIADISTSTRSHTATMNAVEGFFGVGAIVGPAVVTSLLAAGVSWKWLYVIAASLAVVLMAVAALVRYPQTRIRPAERQGVSFSATLRMMRNRHAMGFAIGLFLYVVVECAIYVWMPTLFAGYSGSLTTWAAYSLSIFFVLRAAGRFLGSWLLARVEWSLVVMLFGVAIFLCFLGSMVGGPDTAVVLLPLSGLFMSVLYPTLNSKGISCVPKEQHGTVAGLNLFFSCLAAAAGPLAMGVVSDAFGSPRHGFILATVCSGLLALGLLWNLLLQPAREVLLDSDRRDYAV